jgi:hypothetical protein
MTFCCSMVFSFSCFDSCLVPRQKRLPYGFRMALVFKNKFDSQCPPGKQMHKPLYTSLLNDDCLCGKTQAAAIRHPVRGDPTHDYLRRPNMFYFLTRSVDSLRVESDHCTLKPSLMELKRYNSLLNHDIA